MKQKIQHFYNIFSKHAHTQITIYCSENTIHKGGLGNERNEYFQNENLRYDIAFVINRMDEIQTTQINGTFYA